METLLNYLPYVLIGLGIIAFIIIIAIGYVKAPPDKAIIISGPRKKPKILIGRAGIKIPFIERKDSLLLKQISVDIKTNGFIQTNDFIGVSIDAIAKIKINTDPEGIELAMKNFLNMTEAQIVESLTQSLEGNMREIIGTITLKSLCTDQESFGNQVQDKAQKDMNALGIEIISCNIQKLVDEKNLIIALGQDNMAKIQKDASIAKANAEKEIAIAQANADKAANDAKVEAETEIAIKQNELAIKKAELKKEADIKQAEADAAYKIQEQEQRKSIEISSANADIARQEREVELKTKAAQVMEQELAASIKKKADAQKYADEQKAEVELYQRKKDAEAARYEEEQKAEALKKKAEAEKFAEVQRAEGIRLVGEAEAAAIRAKGIAEAEGIEKKAEAMRKMGEASVVEMICNAYPQIAEAVAKPLSNVDSIVMYGDGNSTKMIQDIVNTASQAMNGIEAATGLNLQALISGYVGSQFKKPEVNQPISTEDSETTTQVSPESSDDGSSWMNEDIDE